MSTRASTAGRLSSASPSGPMSVAAQRQSQSVASVHTRFRKLDSALDNEYQLEEVHNRYQKLDSASDNEYQLEEKIQTRIAFSDPKKSGLPFSSSSNINASNKKILEQLNKDLKKIIIIDIFLGVVSLSLFSFAAYLYFYYLKVCPSMTETTTTVVVSAGEGPGGLAQGYCEPFWLPWASCSQTCGVNATRLRLRTLASSSTCDISRLNITMVEHQNCGFTKCLAPCQKVWSTWSNCSSICGPGTRTRVASINITGCYAPKGNAVSEERAQCISTASCPINIDHCQMVAWMEWTPCNATCSVGMRTRDVIADPAVIKFCNLTMRQVGKCNGTCPDGCRNSPCEHNGTCGWSLGDSGGYSCVCVQGYAGYHCQYEIPQCRSAPCLNGGSCSASRNVSNLRSYSCSCPQGYSGLNCEIPYSQCQSSPCLHGASCVPTERYTAYKCACLPGFSGSRCQTRNCPLAKCSNNSTCNLNDSLELCTCLPGYEGLQCTQVRTVCTSFPCLDSSSCVQGDPCSCLLTSVKMTCQTNDATFCTNATRVSVTPCSSSCGTSGTQLAYYNLQLCMDPGKIQTNWILESCDPGPCPVVNCTTNVTLIQDCNATCSGGGVTVSSSITSCPNGTVIVHSTSYINCTANDQDCTPLWSPWSSCSATCDLGYRTRSGQNTAVLWTTEIQYCTSASCAGDCNLVVIGQTRNTTNCSISVVYNSTSLRVYTTFSCTNRSVTVIRYQDAILWKTEQCGFFQGINLTTNALMTMTTTNSPTIITNSTSSNLFFHCSDLLVFDVVRALMVYSINSSIAMKPIFSSKDEMVLVQHDVGSLNVTAMSLDIEKGLVYYADSYTVYAVYYIVPSLQRRNVFTINYVRDNIGSIVSMVYNIQDRRVYFFTSHDELYSVRTDGTYLIRVDYGVGLAMSACYCRDGLIYVNRRANISTIWEVSADKPPMMKYDMFSTIYSITSFNL